MIFDFFSVYREGALLLKNKNKTTTTKTKQNKTKKALVGRKAGN
jgi:hypothetical protein